MNSRPFAFFLWLLLSLPPLNAADFSGVEKLLNEEMKRAMCMTGVPRIGEITESILIADDVGIGRLR